MPNKPQTHRPPGQRTGQQAAARQYNQRPDRAADLRFYNGANWRRLRKMFLSERPLCAECERQGLLVSASEVHHKQPRKERPDLALDMDNLEGLCLPCHSRRSLAERRERGRGVGGA